MKTLLIAILLAFVVYFLAVALHEQPDPYEVEVPKEISFSSTTSTAPPSTTTTTTSTAPARHVRIVPTTTTTVARSAPIYSGSIPDAIRAGFARFGPVVAEEAVRVSECETAGSFNPKATGSQGERGLFQIHPKYHQERIKRLGFSWDRMYEVGPNITVAADLYAEQGWGPWTCRSAA